jgi:hypothetical protein
MRRIECKICGEEAGKTGSMSGLVHKWGPCDHEFIPVEVILTPEHERFADLDRHWDNNEDTDEP